MREPLKDKGRLEHILASIERIERFMTGMTFDDLRKDEVTYYAVVKCIEIIGEASYICLPTNFVMLTSKRLGVT